MADVQKEDGYTPIAHKILEALAKFTLSPDEWKVLIVIFRKTYGWDKKFDNISYGQFSELTGIRRDHVVRVVDRLVKKNIIFKVLPERGVPRVGNGGVPYVGNRFSATYGFQKNYDLWCSPCREQSELKVFPTQGTGVFPVQGTGVFPAQGTTIDNNKLKELKDSSCPNSEGVPHAGNSSGSEGSQEQEKEVLQESPSPAHPGPPEPPVKAAPKMFSPDSDPVRLSELLLQKILERKPNFRRPNLHTWAVDVDRMIRIDRRTPAGLARVIEWCQKDRFWQDNILSVAKLREKLDQLELKMEKETGVSPKVANGGPKGISTTEKIRQARKEVEEEKKKQIG